MFNWNSSRVFDKTLKKLTVKIFENEHQCTSFELIAFALMKNVNFLFIAHNSTPLPSITAPVAAEMATSCPFTEQCSCWRMISTKLIYSLCKWITRTLFLSAAVVYPFSFSQFGIDRTGKTTQMFTGKRERVAEMTTDCLLAESWSKQSVQINHNNRFLRYPQSLINILFYSFKKLKI